MTKNNNFNTFILQEYVKSKDYVRSPFRYPGGKFYALKYILPYINCVPHDEFREPFVGGGSIFFGKEKVKKNWINDLDTKMINIYKVFSKPELREPLLEDIKNETVSKERYQEIKECKTTNKLEEVYKTYFLNRTSFSGIINKPSWGYAVGKSSPPENWPKLVRPAGKKLEENVQISNLDFEDVINAPSSNKNVLIYLDPPYYHADQKRAYKEHFEEEDHIRLANVLKKTPHYFCLSYDDCLEIRELYSWANIFEKSWIYNTANIKNDTRKKGNELIITNYNVAKSEQLQLI